MSKIDINKLVSDIKKDAIKQASDDIKKKGIEIECPYCGKTVNTKLKKTTCPHCKKTFDVKMK